MRFRNSYLFLLFIILGNALMAQNYQAINGSPYAGSLAPANNPAAIVHVPYAWDITPFSIQFKQATNAYTIQKYSLLSSPVNAEISSVNGTMKRFLFANQDVRLLNTRMNVSTRASIAFGATVREYLYAFASESNWQDTVFKLGDFMKNNKSNLPLAGLATGTSWIELYGTYARRIIDDGVRLLNAGLTIKVSRGLAGFYARADELTYSAANNGGTPGYQLDGGSLQYGYSNNFDFIDSNKSFTDNRKLFLQRTYSGIGGDLGLEYILRTAEDNEAAGEYAYRTKIGVAILDMGSTKFRYGRESRTASGVKTGIIDTLLEDKFVSVGSLGDFNDSLASIAGAVSGLNGEFFIYQPTRLMINVDQHIINNFFINTEINIPILPIFSESTLIIRDMNLLAVTPRWELESIGAYLPVSMNTKKQVWVGAAFKIGPVLLGTHNLGNLFSRNTVQNGGAYLALTVRPGKNHTGARSADVQLPRRLRRSLDCPKF